MTTPDLAQLAHEFRSLAVARRLFGTSSVEVARSDPAAARLKQERLIAATGGARRPAYTNRNCLETIIYRPKTPVKASPIIYIHGGGLVYYDVGVYADWLQEVADRSGRVVAGLAYPKAPESAPPDIARWVQDESERLCSIFGAPITLAGDSVGGLLALDLARRAQVQLERILLICPVLNLSPDREFASYASRGRGFGLDREFMDWFRDLAARAVGRDYDPLSGPGTCPTVPIHVVTAGCDLLRDESLEFVARSGDKGYSVVHSDFARLPHDFWLYPGFRVVADALASIVATHLEAPRAREIVTVLDAHGAGV